MRFKSLSSYWESIPKYSKVEDYLHMEIRIETRYVWYNKGTTIVMMYFINDVPFTFDELPDGAFMIWML